MVDETSTLDQQVSVIFVYPHMGEKGEEEEKGKEEEGDGGRAREKGRRVCCAVSTGAVSFDESQCK